MASPDTPPGGVPDRRPPRRSRRRSVAAAILLSVLAASAARGASLYLSPRLDTEAGATSNRFLGPRAEASPFLRLTPALEVVWFGPADWEGSAGLAHTATRFTRPGFQSQQETRATASLWRGLPSASLSAAVEAGVYRDRAIPEDDAAWVQAAVAFQATSTRRVSAALSARLTGTRFDSQTASDGALRSDRHWTLQPGLRWRPGWDATLWADAVLEGATSNADAGSFRGAGWSAGLDGRWHEALDAGLWVRWQRRRFAAADRTDTPAGAGAWGTLRLSSWAELTARAHTFDHRSTRPREEYREWGVEAGLRLRYDWPLTR